MARAKTEKGKEIQDANLQLGMWKRGDPSPNPNGRPRRILRQLEEKIGIEFNVTLSKEDKFQIIESLLELSVFELEKIAQDKKAPVFLVTVAAALREDIDKCRMYSAELIFDRMFGKPKQSTDITTGGEKLPTTIIKFVGDSNDGDTDTPEV